MNIACQEALLPGSTTLERWALAQSFGFDALELHGRDLDRIREDRLEWQAAVKSGVVVSSICFAGPPFIGDFDAGNRAIAIERMKRLLECAAELGARGVVTPAAYGLFSKRLPPFTPPRDEAGDRAVLLEGLHALGIHAQGLGVKVFFEPLNRYEDHMVNTLAEGVSYVEAVGLASVQIIADTFHMNIEEAHMADSIRTHARHVGHIHIGDSNRLEAGKGHTDFRSIVQALEEIRFDGFLAFEHRLSGEAHIVLPQAVQVLRRATTHHRS